MFINVEKNNQVSRVVQGSMTKTKPKPIESVIKYNEKDPEVTYKKNNCAKRVDIENCVLHKS